MLEDEDFNDIEMRILEKLFQKRRWFSTLQVSKMAKYSWETTEKYLKRLYKDGFVNMKTIGKKTNWQFNYERYYKLRKQRRQKGL